MAPTERTPPAEPRGIGGWENEGGQTDAPVPRLPGGIVATPTTLYTVGPYRYTQLADAEAELNRQRTRGD